MKKLVLIIGILAIVFAISACQAPRSFCFNEPTIGPDGRAINHVECVSTGYSGRG